jgi:hypothetical protein
MEPRLRLTRLVGHHIVAWADNRGFGRSTVPVVPGDALDSIACEAGVSTSRTE